jgi:hypothetical protein
MVRRLNIVLMIAIAIAISLLASFPRAPAAYAALGPECSWYDYQSDAQHDLNQVLENYPEIIESVRQLDVDGDGVACPDLPQRPSALEHATRVVGNFEPSFVGDVEPRSDSVEFEGVGYSARYNVRLAGVSLGSGANEVAREAACADLVTYQDIARLLSLPESTSSVRTSRQFYLESATTTPLPPDENDGRYSVNALAWTVFDDPAAPVLINEWLIRNGLAFVHRDTPEGEFRQSLEQGQEAAQAEGLGVWGACVVPADLVAPPAPPEGRIAQQRGSGDQVIPFTITAEGTYLVSLNVAADLAVFAAVDIYTLDGTLLPALSMSTAESGTFTAAGYLTPGEYYAQIKAVGSWQITVDVMA